LDPNSVSTDNISRPRTIKVNEIKIIDSQIINFNIVSTVSKWVNELDNNNKFAYFRQSYLPYRFKLLLRGSRDGFTPKKFHELCDGISSTVTFIKVKGTEEILNGYNPLKWESSDIWGKTKDSFIFSFKNKNDYNDAIISNVKYTDYALNYHPEHGPIFGSDIIIWASKNQYKNYNTIFCRKYYYEKAIRNTVDNFSIEDYEIFQIIKS